MEIIYCLLSFLLGFLLRRELYPIYIKKRVTHHVLQASFISNSIEARTPVGRLTNAEREKLEKKRDEHRAIAAELNSLLTKKYRL